MRGLPRPPAFSLCVAEVSEYPSLDPLPQATPAPSDARALCPAVFPLPLTISTIATHLLSASLGFSKPLTLLQEGLKCKSLLCLKPSDVLLCHLPFFSR